MEARVRHYTLPGLGSEWWTVLVAVTACVIILTGTYRFLEKFLTTLVVTFTVITVTCAVLLQLTPYAITWQEVMGGLTFHWPEMAVVPPWRATQVRASVRANRWPTPTGVRKRGMPDLRDRLTTPTTGCDGRRVGSR